MGDQADGVAALEAAGACLGGVSGYLVSRRRMAPFVATLAIMTIARGLAFVLSKGSPILLEESGEGLRVFGRGYALGLPQPAVLLLAVFVVLLLVLRFTVFGRIVVAIGSNEEAVRLSGLLVWAYKFAVYVICGALSAMADVSSSLRA